jgi:hypothetical protein
LIDEQIIEPNILKSNVEELVTVFGITADAILNYDKTDLYIDLEKPNEDLLIKVLFYLMFEFKITIKYRDLSGKCIFNDVND